MSLKISKYVRMLNLINFLICLFIFSGLASAASPETKRTTYFSNDKVNVWKTIIYPSKRQTLKMHRHDNNRVLVALDSGELKIVDDKGRAHYLKLENEKAYYLTKDPAGVFHTDENISHHPVKVVVIELKS